ncbi:ribosomal L28e/Mak16, partial [Melampsora americana]
QDNASSADLQWLLLRGWNSKMVSRGGITFSREAGNLKNYHSYRYSGLAQTKPLSITAAPKGGVLYTTKKEGANPRHLTSARKTVRARGACIGTRKAAGKAAKIANSYRPDLVKAAVVRAARIAETTRKAPKSA